MSNNAQTALLHSPVANAGEGQRASFITRTYLHLLGAISAFTMIEVWLFSSGLAEPIAQALLGVSWLVVLGGFMVVGWLATHTASVAQSRRAQYLALGTFVAGEAVIFVPLLHMADQVAPGAIQAAAQTTLMGFGALTMIAFMLRWDFSFLGAFLRWAFLLALVGIIAGVLFGFSLGTGFAVVMVGLAGASILYDTSRIIHDYPEDRYVAASLQLFASVALLFWYLLQLYMEKS